MGFVSDHDSKREALIQEFLATRKVTEDLCKPLVYEDYLLSVTADTSPPKWHLAHTTWFFEHFLLRKLIKSYEPYRAEFNFLFNSYYQSVGKFISKDKRNALSRPTTLEIFEYRKAITNKVSSEIFKLDEGKFNDIRPILELGINHEQQH